jgi:4-amino-4-deoxy-L-arabinose transferase-like glycosyltransferase
LVALCKGLAGGRVGWLIAAALAASLATLTRYAGIILVGTVFLAALALYPRPPLARLGCVALAGIEGMAASVAWSLHNEAVANSVTDRSLALHLVTVPQLWQMVTTLGHYVVPEELPLPGLIRVLVFGTILVVGTWLAASAYVKSKGPWERLNAAQWALIMFAIGYPVFIALSISIADNGVRFAA